MENSAQSTEQVANTTQNTTEVEEIVIDLANLTSSQKMSLLAVIGSIVLQIVFLLNMLISLPEN